jgi:hypothetical protein
MHIDHDLLHGLEHMSLQGQNLFKCRWGWCVGGVAAPGVDHLTNMI